MERRRAALGDGSAWSTGSGVAGMETGHKAGTAAAELGGV
jgi:hypothetical protein